MFNEILQKVTGKPDYKFNPRYFMCNEGDTNHKAIKYVYGEEFAKGQSGGMSVAFQKWCHKEGHIYPRKYARYLQQNLQKPCKSTTINQYNLLKGQLEELAMKYPPFNPWIQWWHVHRSHIFAPFRGGGLPGVNLSEMGNAGWKPYSTLRLVHATKQDTAAMILQEKEIPLQ